ncbi:MAG TPA: pyridoxamine 5'-phosphate oxidase family protein [Nitrolancea sp.]|nr:pyridoxamine 5'-phosphate oxidase family protein [Nitrolancea sp.]
MHESSDDLARLDEQLRASIERAGPFLRSSFGMPAHSLNARRLARHLQGAPTVALATVTTKGEPRVTPIGAFFVRGHFYIPTTMHSARVRHLRRQPAISLTLFEGIEFAVIVHGTAVVLGEDSPDFEELIDIQRESQSASVRDWGEGAFIRIDADVIYTYALNPEQYPE